MAGASDSAGGGGTRSAGPWAGATLIAVVWAYLPAASACSPVAVNAPRTVTH